MRATRGVRANGSSLGALLLVAAASAGCAQGIAAESINACPSAAPNAAHEVPAHIVNDLVIVEVEIDGLRRPARMVFDTGALSVIREEIVSEVERRPAETTQTVGFIDAAGRRLQASSVVLAEVRVGTIELADVPAIVIDSRAFDLVCPPLDGILGTGGPYAEPGFLDRIAVQISPSPDYSRGLTQEGR